MPSPSGMLNKVFTAMTKSIPKAFFYIFPENLKRVRLVLVRITDTFSWRPFSTEVMRKITRRVNIWTAEPLPL